MAKPSEGQQDPEQLRREVQERCGNSFERIAEDLKELVGNISGKEKQATKEIVAEYEGIKPKAWTSGDPTTERVHATYDKWENQINTGNLSPIIETSLEANAQTWEELETRIHTFLHTPFGNAKEALAIGQELDKRFHNLVWSYVESVETHIHARQDKMWSMARQLLADASSIQHGPEVAKLPPHQTTDADYFHKRLMTFAARVDEILPALAEKERKECGFISNLGRRFSENVILPYIGVYAYTEEQTKKSDEAPEQTETS